MVSYPGEKIHLFLLLGKSFNGALVISLSESRFWVNKTFKMFSLCLQSFEALNFYKFLDTFENREGFKLDFKIFSLILKIKIFLTVKSFSLFLYILM